MIIKSKTNWEQVNDQDLPIQKVSVGKVASKRTNFFYMESTKEVGMAIALCRHCLAIYALISTAKAMHPHEEWLTLPHHQLMATGLDRYQIRWAVKKLEKASLVTTWRQSGRKTKYKIIKKKP